MRLILSSFLIALSLPLATAEAASSVNLVPVAEQDQHVRYQQGIPTIENSIVRVMPMRDLDHGSIQFRVAIYNTSANSFNFGVENIKAYQNGDLLETFTRDQLEAKAKNRARWSQFGYAMLAGVAAAAQNNNTYATTYTPHGTYSTVIHNPGLSDGQVAAVAAGGGAIALSEIGLQKTLDAIGNEIIQTTTIDPGSGYGGRIIIGKLKNSKSGDTVRLTIDTGGSVQNFTFTVQ